MVEGDGFYKGLWGNWDDAEGATLDQSASAWAKADPTAPRAIGPLL